MLLVVKSEVECSHNRPFARAHARFVLGAALVIVAK
jgi:hypothetical protein